ncbi:MAG: ABC transporter permease [Polyangiaceae bacterium]
MTPWFVAIKDLRLLLRDRVALFWVFVFPLGFALLFGEVLASAARQEDRALSLLVVGESRTADGVVDGLARATGLTVLRQTRDEAHAAVRRGESVAYMVVSPDAKLELVVDPTRMSEGAALAERVRRALQPAVEGQDAGLTVSRLDARNTPGRASAFPAALLWCLLACSATFAVSLAAERTAGTEARLRAAPVSRASIVAGKAMAAFVACVGACLLLVGVAHVLLGVRAHDGVALALALVSTSVCFVGLTFLFGAMGDSETAVAGAGWGTLIVMAMLGGAMVPLSALPDGLRVVSNVSPVKWGIVVLEGAYFRAFSFGELAAPCAGLVLAGVAAGGLGVALSRRRHAL